MSEATLIFPNMRGGCATVGNTVHALFRVNGRRPSLATLARRPEAVEHSTSACNPGGSHVAQGD